MLTALQEGDQVHGIDITNSSTTLPRFKIENTPSVGYIDIGSDDIKTGNNVPGIARPNASPIENWDRFARTFGDFNWVRDRISELYVNPLNTYTTEEQQVLLTNQVPEVEDLESVFTPQQVREARIPYLEMSRAVRKTRLDVTTTVLQSTLGSTQSDTAIGILLGVVQGIPGVSNIGHERLYIWGNLLSLQDFLYSRDPFVGVGLLDLGFTPLPTADLTMLELQEECDKILYKGTDRNDVPIYINGNN